MSIKPIVWLALVVVAVMAVSPAVIFFVELNMLPAGWAPSH